MNSLVRSSIRHVNALLLNQRSSGITKFLSFKSSINLENIYPKSNFAITTPQKVPQDTKENFDGYIPIEQLQITYSRSTGPGGQNVNTVNTKVDLRFHVQTAGWLKQEIRAKLLEEQRTKINKEGFLIIRSDKTRSQQLNLADAIFRLRELLRAAAEPQPVASPETEEKLRKRREKNARIRLMEKRKHSQTKASRRAPEVDF